MNITIPTFVPRGLSRMDDPASWSTSVHYSKEEHLRDAMATHWWLNGWAVRTEVKVPDCGRIDVLAEMGMCSVIIELKQSILTPTQARQAFMQAHGYKAYLEAANYESPQRRRFACFVVAGRPNVAAMETAERAFYGVHALHFNAAVQASHSPDPWLSIDEQALDAAAAIARYRAGQLRLLSEAARSASVLVTHASEDRRAVA